MEDEDFFLTQNDLEMTVSALVWHAENNTKLTIQQLAETYALVDKILTLTEQEDMSFLDRLAEGFDA